MNEYLNETNINKQVKDILKTTAQNEVIQSFVRSDADREPEEPTKETTKHWNKEKKVSASSFTGVIKPTTEKSKESKAKADTKARSSVTQPYQQLGRDARFSSKSARMKSDRKRHRRERLIEEVYTDKDRAAAVNLGTRDIKQSLKLKRRQDRSRILEISEEAHPGTLLALAIHRFKTGDVYAALKFVDKVPRLYCSLMHFIRSIFYVLESFLKIQLTILLFKNAASRHPLFLFHRPLN